MVGSYEPRGCQSNNIRILGTPSGHRSGNTLLGIKCSVFRQHLQKMSAHLATWFQSSVTFKQESRNFPALHTKEVARASAIERTMEKTERHQFKALIKEWLVGMMPTVALDQSHNHLISFGNLMSKATKLGKQLILMKRAVNLFSFLHVGCQRHDCNGAEFFKHAGTTLPRCQEWPDEVPERSFQRHRASHPPRHDAINGAVAIQMPTPGTAKTFNECLHTVLIPYVSEQLQNGSCLDLPWDRDIISSEKGKGKEKECQAYCCCCTTGRKLEGLPLRWQEVLQHPLKDIDPVIWVADEEHVTKEEKHMQDTQQCS